MYFYYKTIDGNGTMRLKHELTSEELNGYEQITEEEFTAIAQQREEIAKKTKKEPTELQQLYMWFKWYDCQVAQYNRCQRIGEEFNIDINELDLLAQKYAARIKELRDLEKNK